MPSKRLFLGQILRGSIFIKRPILPRIYTTFALVSLVKMISQLLRIAQIMSLIN